MSRSAGILVGGFILFALSLLVAAGFIYASNHDMAVLEVWTRRLWYILFFPSQLILLIGLITLQLRKGKEHRE